MKTLRSWLPLSLVLLAWCAPVSVHGQEEHPLPNLGTAVLQNRMMTQRWYGLEEQLKMRALDKKALAHAAAWREGERAPDPVAGREGRVVFRFGPSTRIVCAPLHVCDVELEPGERIVGNAHVGDDEGWDVMPMESGALPPVTHLIIKPFGASIATNLIVPTDRRTYHLELVAAADEKAEYMPFVAFSYPDSAAASWSAYMRKSSAAPAPLGSPEAAPAPDDLQVDLSNVNMAYEINRRGRWNVRRNIRWVPVRAWDNGKKTFIEMPYAIERRELPILLVCEDDDEDCNGDGDGKIVNYAVKGRRFIVDRLFVNAVLIKGIGWRRQERVSINAIED